MAETQTKTVTEAPKADVAEAVTPVVVPAEAKSIEAKPVEAKPAAPKSVEAKSAEPKPVAAKPAVAAPAAPAPAVVKQAKAEKTPPAKKAAAARAKIVKKTQPKAASIVKKKTRPAKAAAAKTVRKPVRTGLPTQMQGANIMTKQTEAGVFAADQFKNVFGDVNERAKDAMERSAKIVEELADLTRGNVEALVASSKVAAKGVETLSQDAAEYSRKSFEEASATLKSFAEVKSATDLFKLQSDFARSAFDAAVAESARVSEQFLKIASDVAEPINSRYTVAAERVKTLAAA
jgi:phasin family protein